MTYMRPDGQTDGQMQAWVDKQADGQREDVVPVWVRVWNSPQWINEHETAQKYITYGIVLKQERWHKMFGKDNEL